MEYTEITGEKNNRRYNREEREYHVKRWEESGQNKTEYSRQNNIPPTTFFTWTRKKRVREKGSRFIEVKINNRILAEDNKIELLIGNKVLRMREDISPEIIKNIIVGLEGI